jgi:hypothetical protein
MPFSEKWRRIFIAHAQVRDGHRAWFLERNPGAAEFEVVADWMRLNGAAEILAEAMRDAAEREGGQTTHRGIATTIVACQTNR